MHNIESKYLGSDDDEKMVLKRIMKQKKEDSKMRAISHILGTFFVNTVYNRGGDFTYLEILGSAVNVEIAEYVASVLHVELDKLWKQAQQSTHLRGMVAKNSFFLGLAKGYCDKIQAVKKTCSSEVTNALIVIEKQLIDAKEMAYRRLRSPKAMGVIAKSPSSLGEQMGRQLNINPAVNGSPNNPKVNCVCKQIIASTGAVPYASVASALT